MSYTQVSIFLYACFTRHRKRKESFRIFSKRFFAVEEIKDNKLYRIGIKMKILLYNIFHSGVCMCGRSKWEDRIKLKAEKHPLSGKNKNTSWSDTREMKVRRKAKRKKLRRRKTPRRFMIKLNFWQKLLLYCIYIHLLSFLFSTVSRVLFPPKKILSSFSPFFSLGSHFFLLLAFFGEKFIRRRRK